MGEKPERVILLPEIFYFVDALGKAERHKNLILLDFSKYGDPKEEHNHLTYLAICSDCYLNWINLSNQNVSLIEILLVSVKIRERKYMVLYFSVKMFIKFTERLKKYFPFWFRLFGCKMKY